MWNRLARRGAAGVLNAQLLAAVAFFNHVNFCSGEDIPQFLVAAIIAKCSMCDIEFGLKWAAAFLDFNAISSEPGLTPRDLGRLHCSEVLGTSDCYTTCLMGTSYPYSSPFTEPIKILSNICNDRDCDVSYVPGCYSANGVQMFSGYGFSTSACDLNQPGMSANISQCFDQYASQQNCTGSCTAGQRALQFMRLNQEAICRTQLASSECNTEVQVCLAQTFGVHGIDFLLGNSWKTLSSDAICSQGIAFSTCMANTVFGIPPFGITPCLPQSGDIAYLVSLSDAIFQPFCDHPSQSYDAVCPMLSAGAGNGTTPKSCLKRRR